MESRLKDDILREAERYQGAIMVIHETDDGQISDAWEQVSLHAVQTPREVFRCLEADGFPIKYARVPITDGKAPKSSDFDTLALNIVSASKDTAFVFNCQMGIGRTTTGTVISCLLKLRIDYGRPIRVLVDEASRNNLSSHSHNHSDDEIKDHHVSASISTCAKSKADQDSGHAFGINDILLLWKITRLFDNGVECREALDVIIDRCSALQNIRQAVLQYRQVFDQQHVEPRERRVALNRGAEYLERYFRLIAFAAYLGSEAFDGFCGQGETKMSFKTWLHQSPEVQAMKWSIRLRPGRFFTVPEELRAPHESQHGDAVMEAIVKERNGSVLGKGSILKMYFFPGQRTSSVIQIHGAPHVYKVDEYPVYSMATPTIQDDEKETKHLQSLQGANQSNLRLFQMDLLNYDSIVAAVTGATGVFHVASPCIVDQVHDAQVELLDPAIKGTINVLTAAKEAGVRRVVVTSSISAIVPSPNWSADVVWYPLSKTLAEKAAWKFAKEKGLDIVVVNPGTVMGPIIPPAINASMLMILRLLQGCTETYEDFFIGLVHVKDVALAHILVYENTLATGRHLCVEAISHYGDFAAKVAELYPDYKVPRFSPGPPITCLSAMCGSKSRDVPELVRVCSLFILLAPKGAYYHGTYNTKLLHPPSKILQHLAAPPRIRTPHPGGVSPAVHLLYQLSCAPGGYFPIFIEHTMVKRKGILSSSRKVRSV
ncbi:hypothetical protein RD792_006772 [Penstemon davidsonii]|uniref:NAD-dependent epimerase/dehydratase domain-containing protein n=1 Tax=Penstemon davidsonii TaxID=160366 RepID=A0ABR0DBS0_9LAMI|nr:hypothetical protein RD792_006772 [Penstemon davidsonii]